MNNINRIIMSVISFVSKQLKSQIPGNKYLLLIVVMLCNNCLEAQNIIFTPQWITQSQFAGYYVAEALGYYKAEHLKVEIVHTSGSTNAFNKLTNKSSQIITLNLSQALSYNCKGAQLINIMQILQRNDFMFVAHFPFKGPASLQNKKVGVWHYVDQQLLDFMTAKYNLRINRIRFNSGINLFLSGAVDVSIVNGYNEFLQLKECGVKLDSTHILKLSDYGYNIPEEGVYVTKDYYNKHKTEIQKFVKASKKGWLWASKHRKEALDIVMEKVSLNKVSTNRYHQRQMLDAVLLLQKNVRSGIRSYRLDKIDFEHALDLMPYCRKEKSIKYEAFVK